MTEFEEDGIEAEERCASVVVGVEPTIVTSIRDGLSTISNKKSGLSFLVAQLFHPRLLRKCADSRPFARSDSNLNSSEWANVVASIDAGRALQSASSEKDFGDELDFSSYMSIEKVVIRMPPTSNDRMDGIPRIASILLDKLINAQLVSQTFVAAFPFNAESWERWNALRMLCRYDRQLVVGLELTGEDTDDWERWLAEPVYFIFVPTRIFLTNKAGYPVLPRRLQAIIKQFLRRPGIGIVVKGECRRNSIDDYSAYIHHLNKTKGTPTVIDAFESSYYDSIQTPLQPLAESLESQIYETFEKDTVKYVKYEEAISAALTDLRKEDNSELTAFVLGAGRGPLVRCILNASESKGVPVHITAVEKNSGCFNSLTCLNETDWQNKVNIVRADFRKWNPGVLADLIVSELLGSFGDNELCPECLDDTSRLLKETGINIPQEHCSYLAPIHAPRAYSEVAKVGEYCRAKNTGLSCWSKFEVPYVVAFGCHKLIGKAKPAFSFFYPNREEHSNDRFISCTFDCDQDSLLTGLAGYFDSQLYKNVRISTVPGNRTEAMTSWFAMYFPIKEPIQLRSGDKISVVMWRKSDQRRVWYEWGIVEPVCTRIHNCGGSSYHMLQ